MIQKKLRMGQSGQGFDVFKLLIAAVVAGAILLILLQTLQVLPPIGSTTANNAATNAVKSKINELGLPQIVENVSFKNGDSLNARTIAEGSKALSSEEVCVLTSTEAPNYGSFTGNDQVIKYVGNFEQKVRLLVVCDRSGDIEKTLEDYEYAGASSEFAIDVTDCSDTFAVDASSKRVCLVAIIP